MINIGIITVFPNMFAALNYGIVGRAQKQNILQLHFWDPRDFSQNKHKNIDDKPYGGGPGMIMLYAPLRDAIVTAKKKLGQDAKVIYLSPRGKRLQHVNVATFSQEKNLILLAGRYEGIDQRLIENKLIDEEWSIGDYVLSGGELAAMVMIDAITRLQPQALGNPKSAKQDSFSTNLLEYPHYTRPTCIDGLAVPSTLLSGDHEAVHQWQLKKSLGKTWEIRPDLLAKRQLNANEQNLLNDYIEELGVNYE